MSTPDRLPVEETSKNELQQQYSFYHKQWWCYRDMFYRFKWSNGLLNALALIILAIGTIVGPVLKDTLVMATLSAIGIIVKGWNEYKHYSEKVEMCRFAYTTYAKTLTELRIHSNGLPVEEIKGFLIKMQTLDDIITDFSPPVSDKCMSRYREKFNKSKNTTTKWNSQHDTSC